MPVNDATKMIIADTLALHLIRALHIPRHEVHAHGLVAAVNEKARHYLSLYYNIWRAYPTYVRFAYQNNNVHILREDGSIVL